MSQKESPDIEFVWRGKKLVSYGDIIDAVSAIHDKETAEEFFEEYVASGVRRDTARQNIGYLAGYLDRDTARRVFDLFETTHPVFGRSFPSPEKAFEMGKEMAEQWKREKEGLPPAPRKPKSPPLGGRFVDLEDE
jgi:hypothetical protein